MGIRYYAYPVAPRHAEAAAADPESFIADDPLADAWGMVPVAPNTYVTHAKPIPEMLYLDKCWRYLQQLTTRPDGTTRVAHDLFEGDVTMVNGGMQWIGYQKALSPAAVAAIADDLEAMSEHDLQAYLDTLEDEDKDYVRQFLQRAIEFTVAMRERGYGLAYAIQ